MATSNVSVSDDEQLKRHLLWKKVNDPTFSEEPKVKKSIYQTSSLGKAGVPMIPEEILAGSRANVKENKVFRSMKVNPFVPLGMGLTVACLIGMFKASLKHQQKKTQYYMRGRIAAQFFTICALVGGAVIFGADPRGYSKPGEIPKQPDSITKALLQIKN